VDQEELTQGYLPFYIQCQITGATASSWSWTKTPINGGSTQQITQGSKYSIQNSPSNPFITINNIVEEDEADYACQATNVAGSASSFLLYMKDLITIYFKCQFTYT
jgi:hypothetical protein